MVGLTPHAVGTLWLIPALPLAGATIAIFFGNRLGKWGGVLATALVFASFGLSSSSAPSSAWVTARTLRCASTIVAIAATISRIDVASKGKK